MALSSSAHQLVFYAVGVLPQLVKLCASRFFGTAVEAVTLVCNLSFHDLLIDGLVSHGALSVLGPLQYSSDAKAGAALRQRANTAVENLLQVLVEPPAGTRRTSCR